jgi:type III secretion HrpO family protein
MIRTQLVQIAYQGLIMILILSAPPVMISLILGLVVAIFQAATQIQEQTLASTVKLVAVVLVLLMMGTWLGAEIYSFSANIFENFWTWGAD